MNEKPTEKKMVRRSVAIALGIICIILFVGVVAAFGYYIPEKDITISSRDNTISCLNSQIVDDNFTIGELDGRISEQNSTIFELNSLLSSANSQISQLNSIITDMQTQITDIQAQIKRLNDTVNQLNDTVNLKLGQFWMSGLWNASQSGNSVGLGGILNKPQVPYAGYVKFQIEPYNNVYAMALYSSMGFDFNYEVPFNANGTAIIPVLPTNFITIGVENLTIGTAYSWSVTYYY
jgi:uncharacterized coiled-coil protein SlyX